MLFRIIRYPLRLCGNINEYLLDKIIVLKKEIEYQKTLSADFPGFEEEETFFSHISVITHAGGGVDGCTYLNCKEGLNSWIMCSKAFEMDITRCIDGVYVCTHEKLKTDSRTFLKQKEDFRFTRISLVELLDFVKSNPEIKLFLDCKFNRETRMQDMADMADFIYRYLSGAKEILDKIVIQVRNEAEVAILRKTYHYRLLWNYMGCDGEFSHMVKDCILHDVHAISVPVSLIRESKGWQLFQKCKITIYVYTINRIEDYLELKSLGIRGIFSDFLSVQKLKTYEK